jgi:hypothetical protein
MMLAWSFDLPAAPDVARLLRALGKHRYVREVDHRLHWSVDHALRDHAHFAPHAAAFDARAPRLDLASRDPSLWRPAAIDDVIAALVSFWTPGADADRAGERLEETLASAGLPFGAHPPFDSPPDDAPHPELIVLDWVLLPVDELDPARHAGALAAMEESGDEIDPSAFVYQEGPALAAPELSRGAMDGTLAGDFLIWADGPYSYVDYVLRGAARAAKLAEPPVGYRDL